MDINVCKCLDLYHKRHGFNIFEDLIQQGDATNMFLATLGALVKPLRSQIGPAKPKTRDPR